MSNQNAASQQKPADHPVVTAWIKGTYTANAGGVVVVPHVCTVRLKSGVEYLMPKPPPWVERHVCIEGEDDEGRPLYCSV